MLALAIVMTIGTGIALVVLVGAWGDHETVEPSWPAFALILAFAAGALLLNTASPRPAEDQSVPSSLLPKVPVKPVPAERPGG